MLTLPSSDTVDFYACFCVWISMSISNDTPPSSQASSQASSQPQEMSSVDTPSTPPRQVLCPTASTERASIYWTRTYEGSYKGVEFIWESLSCGFNKLFYKKNGHFVTWGVGQTGPRKAKGETGPCNLKFVKVIDQTDWKKIGWRSGRQVWTC
jgi:hypothetical protein